MENRELITTELDYIVAGSQKALNRNDVVRRLRGAKLGPIRTHAVRVGDVLFPVKKAWAAASGMDLLDFNTNQARNWFRRLGFEIVRVPTAGQETSR